MKMLIRADGNAYLGAGHIMRCLSISDAAKEKSVDCVFACAGSDFAEIIKSRGYECIVLGTDYRRLEKEIDKLCEIIEKQRIDKVLLDSYYATREYMQLLREKVFLIYVDDLLMFDYPVDMLVNYNAYGQNEVYKRLYHNSKDIPSSIITGTYYAPLRKQFNNLPGFEVHEEVANILISTGGSDPEGIAVKIAEFIIANIDFQKYKYHFVVSKLSDYYDVLSSYANKFEFIHLHYNVTNMSDLMRTCDLAVSAAGSTLYELCACGVPTITYILAENQMQGEKFFVENKIMISAGDYRTNKRFIEDVFSNVKSVAGNHATRMKMSEKARLLVDGAGAGHIIDAILSN